MEMVRTFLRDRLDDLWISRDTLELGQVSTVSMVSSACAVSASSNSMASSACVGQVSTVSMASSALETSACAAPHSEVVTQWRGAKGQTPFWADQDIMGSWNLEITETMFLSPFTCLWKHHTSDDAIFSGNGEARGVVVAALYR